MTCGPVGEWLTTAPWRDRAVSLLLVEGSGVSQAFTLTDKRVLAALPGCLLVLWTGQWKTEARIVGELPDPDRATVRDLLA